jgi:single-strand DNA-binding protein
MSASVNLVIVVGRLGGDPELKYTGSNRAVCNMSIATDEYAGKDKERRTEWHKVTVWAEQAEACAKYLKKGSLVFVQGRNQTRSWDDKDGNKRYSTDVVADRVQFLDSKPREVAGAGVPAREPGSDDDSPF